MKSKRKKNCHEYKQQRRELNKWEREAAMEVENSGWRERHGGWKACGGGRDGVCGCGGGALEVPLSVEFSRHLEALVFFDFPSLGSGVTAFLWRFS